MNYLWPIIIIISFIFALINKNVEALNNSMYSSINDVITLSCTLVGNMCLWCGMMQIIQATSLMDKLIKILKPIINWLFPDAKQNKLAMNAISINTVSNILGIGNAATPAGIKAMEEMQKDNLKKDELTDSMIMLIVLNTASIQILPTTIMAIRAALGSSNPANIIVPIWISTITGTIVGIFITKLLLHKKKVLIKNKYKN